MVMTLEKPTVIDSDSILEITHVLFAHNGIPWTGFTACGVDYRDSIDAPIMVKGLIVLVA